MNVYIDIETIPDQRPGARQAYIDGVTAPGTYSRPESIEHWLHAHREVEGDKAWRRTALNGGYGQVVCVCYATERGDRGVCFHATDEARVLREYGADLTSHLGVERATFIGHNVEFDLRFLAHRHMVHGIRPLVPLWYNDAPWKGTYVDTMHMWAGARERIKLTELARILGFPDRPDIDGAHVWDAVADGRMDDVVRHCVEDVDRVRYVYQRMTFEETT